MYISFTVLFFPLKKTFLNSVLIILKMTLPKTLADFYENNLFFNLPFLG